MTDTERGCGVGKVLQYQRRHGGATRLAQSLRWHGHTAVGPGSLRVLLLILRRQAEGRPVTHRWLAQQTGTNINAVHGHLLRLREAGLVAWDDSEGVRAATLRATVRLEVCGGEGAQPVA